MKVRSAILGGILLVMFGVGFAVLADEYNRAGVLSSRGVSTSGERFGVAIGMDSMQARDVLRRRGLTPVELTLAQSCHGRTYTSDEQVELWYDDTWRRGTICVVSRSSRVTVVSWSYNWMAP